MVTKLAVPADGYRYPLQIDATPIELSVVENALLLAAYFRGSTNSSADQIVTLSLFYTGDITSDECQRRFQNRGYVGGLYDDGGNLDPKIKSRYQNLIELLRAQPSLIQGSGDFGTPADPPFTACQLTHSGVQRIQHIINQFPHKPVFPDWPDRQTFPSSDL